MTVRLHEVTEREADDCPAAYVSDRGTAVVRRNPVEVGTEGLTLGAGDGTCSPVWPGAGESEEGSVRLPGHSGFPQSGPVHRDTDPSGSHERVRNPSISATIASGTSSGA
ncbi:hypothetical protein CEP50_08490 [Actinopolyspora mortivallis]|uniref:Uncharacterized protein n=1 Tax=Actinopolyspora mortivallis TaxID=33906 RepID=A0A2T0GXH1_ACTMO|nr:hypothetical protein CEP50_08490 [Actinopolyspora mortivallis]